MHSTFYIIPSNTDAMHHGVLGMKWGVRRYQPYSVVPRGSGKGGEEVGEAARYGSGSSAQDRRAAKKNINTAYKEVKSTFRKKEKYEKLKESGKEISEKKEIKYKDAVNRYEAAINQLDDANYILGDKDYKRSLSWAVGKSTGLKWLIGGVYSIPFSLYKDAGAVDRINNEMTAKKVKREMENQQKESGMPKEKFESQYNNSGSSSKSSSNTKYTNGLNDSQKKRMDNAIKNDKWDMDFLESIQNSKILDDDDVPSMLNEYNKYLKNPEKYWKEDRHKLKQV